MAHITQTAQGVKVLTLIKLLTMFGCVGKDGEKESGMIINATMFKPHKALFKSVKNNKAELKLFSCERAIDCHLYQKGMCLMIGRVFGGKCPHGGWRTEYGFTRRAGKYHQWISDKEGQYKDVLYALKKAPDRICLVADGWVLPYPHIDMNKDIPFERHSQLFISGLPFLKYDELTSGVLVSIVEFKPNAMFGGEIKKYQEKVVPKIVKDIFDYYPELFNRLESEYPEARDIVDGYDYSGRKALIKTLPPGTILEYKKGEEWQWDGDSLNWRKGGNFYFATPHGCKNVILCSVIPDDDAIYEITNNSQVDENTEFVD